jgi:hypothetical protein
LDWIPLLNNIGMFAIILPVGVIEDILEKRDGTIEDPSM